jgi:glutamate-5-semialdehyde dehydrogenase
MTWCNQAMSAIAEICRRARVGGRRLAALSALERTALLREVADALERRAPEVIEANRRDMEAARAAEVAPSLLDRLGLDEDRIADMAGGIRAVAALPDPVGLVDGGGRLANGLQIEKVRVPLGVVAVVYEARPNVTTDAAALCLKSGNAVILRGSSIAAHSNEVLGRVMTEALAEAGAPADCVTLLGKDREELRELISREDGVDLVIPRGGEALKAFLTEHARVPVIYAASGNNHVYVDASADPDVAVKITVNAKVQRPGVCNAAETLLVHRDVAAEFLPAAAEALLARGVELRVTSDARALLRGDAAESPGAVEEDWSTEFLDLVMAVRIVDSLEEAIEHIGTYGSGHSEAIVTRSLDAARTFQRDVDAAAVYVNASTRFTDGGEFGMGAEIGNSTQKLHARGPIGLVELTTYKYLVTGDGQVR